MPNGRELGAKGGMIGGGEPRGVERGGEPRGEERGVGGE